MATFRFATRRYSALAAPKRDHRVHPHAVVSYGSSHGITSSALISSPVITSRQSPTLAASRVFDHFLSHYFSF